MELKDRLLKRHEALKNERAPWIEYWRDISRHVVPRMGRFIAEERNKTKRFNAIIDNTATNAMGTLAAGLMSGMTSPARPWFKLATPDLDLMKYQPVKIWLDEVSKLIHTVFQRSNTYRALHSIYEELAAFGTASSIIVPDFNHIIHHHPLTVGEYAIATNWRGEVDTLYREFQKTVGEVVREFGRDKVSQAVRTQFDNGNLDEWVTIIHIIEPREVRNVNLRDNKNMPWRSVYIEKGASTHEVLRESGFKRFPAVCPRWAVSGGDIYGTSPAMMALGDIKQLQLEQKRKAQAIDYMTNPPLQVPNALKNSEIDLLPGGIVYSDSPTPISSMWQVGLDLNHLQADIQAVQMRINKAFYADLFLMISQQDSRMTATEIGERHEEKMLMLGPVLERLQNELLDPLIETTFDFVMQAGIVPPPPKELQGHEVNVVLVSILAQAQQAIATNSIDRFVGAVGQFAQIKPEVLDKLNGDKWIDIYSTALGVDPNLLVSDEDVKAMREARAQAQQQVEQAQQMQQMAEMAQKLGSTPVRGNNILANLTGYN